MQWPIFTISLKDAHDRREALLAQCDALGLTVEIIDAIDGRQGLPPELEHKIDREGARSYMGREMTDGEFACALSHQSIYERIVRDDLPGAIVLEDDAILSDGFADFIRKQGYLNANLIQMNYDKARHYPWVRPFSLHGLTFVQLAKNADLTAGYSISKTAAQYILSRSRPLAGVADWPCDITPLAPLVTIPLLVDQPEDHGHSELERKRRVIFDNQKKVRPLGRWRRFGHANYWRLWWQKRISRPLKP